MEHERLVVAAGLIWLGPDRLLVQRRSPRADHGAGMLELPGGKVERGEPPADALARELVEEWGTRAGELAVQSIVEVVHHVYPSPGPEVLMLVYDVDGRAWAGARWRERVRPVAGAQVVAYDRDALPVEEFLPADRELIAALRED